MRGAFWAFYGGGSAGGITGTFAATEAPDVLSVTADLTNLGILNVVCPPDAASAVGALSITGTMAAVGNPDYARFVELVATKAKKGSSWQSNRKRDDEQVLMAFLHAYMHIERNMHANRPGAHG